VVPHRRLLHRGQHQSVAEDDVAGSGAGQGQAVLNEQQRGLWFAVPDHLRGHASRDQAYPASKARCSSCSSAGSSD
jgi:hypothetical protein